MGQNGNDRGKSTNRTWIFIIIILVLSLALLLTLKSILFPKKETSSACVHIYDENGVFLHSMICKQESKNVISLDIFEKKGYDCLGIVEIGTNIQLFDANGQQMNVLIDRDYSGTPLYRAKEYEIFFDAAEGSIVYGNPSLRFSLVEAGSVIFPMAYCQGKSFVGWFDEAGHQFSFGDNPRLATPWNIAADSGFSDWANGKIRLQAVYQLLEYNVTLDYNDNSIKPVVFKMPYGSKLPDLSEYYRDNGSAVVIGFSRSLSADNPMTETITSDVTLYAVWSAYKKISFVLDSKTVNTVKAFNDSGMISLEPVERPGYIFDGWYVSPQYTGSAVKKAHFDELADTYYAKWSVDLYTIGQCVKNGTEVKDSNGKVFLVYNTIDGTPWATDRKPSSPGIVVDWSREEDTNLLNYTSYNNLVISHCTDEVFFIGSKNQLFTNMKITVDSFASGQQLTLHFVDFNFITNDSFAIGLHDDDGGAITIDVVGACSIGTSVTGSVLGSLDNPLSNVTFTGKGTMVITAKDGLDGTTVGEAGTDGGTAVYADKLSVSMSGTISFCGGNGGNGAVGSVGNNGRDAAKVIGNSAEDGENGGCGGNGGNGGSALICKQIKIGEKANVIVKGGNGGRGGNGGNGGNAGKPFYPWVKTTGGAGGAGGKSGVGALGIQCNDFEYMNKVNIVNGISLGDGASGIKGADNHG